MTESYVFETENNRRARLVALLIVVFLVSAGIAAAILSIIFAAPTPAHETFVERYTPGVLKDITPLKQFGLSTLSGIIIIPLPNEAPFYMGLRQGQSPMWTVIATTLGFILGNVITYLMGRQLSKQMIYLLSTKHIYHLRRKVNRYGVHAIIFLNILPLPSDVLTFGLGMTRYNPKRLFIIMTLANAIKFSAFAYVIIHLPNFVSF